MPVPRRTMTRRPPAGLPSLYAACYAEGARAASAGAPSSLCPYDGAARGFSRVAWLDGWVMRARSLGNLAEVDPNG